MASLNPFDPNFKLSVCDGPAYAGQPSNYTPCDFAGLMTQAQHLINAMIILGVLAAMVSFTWAGALLIWSGPEKKSDAKKIFEKTFWGLIMMLTAWFIVYQLLDWLAASEGVKTLLGRPI